MLTIDASLTMSRLQGLVMKPLLRRLNLTLFVHEAERRARSWDPARGREGGGWRVLSTWSAADSGPSAARHGSRHP
jgi:hypothetical protein